MLKRSDTGRVGRYELVTMLGEGGMARVYLAINRGPIGFNKLVVVKQVRPELAWDREFLAMFFDEARIAARLNHPNVVQTYEVIEETGQYLLAMEYLEGQTLGDVLRRVGRANMPLEEHLWVLTQVLTGLQYAHDLCDYDGSPLGVVHRDVSPSNVFITYNGEVKLLDFGIAKAAGAVSATQKGMVKGKIGYGAPEQFFGDGVDRRADIYSVGIMLWEALARKRRKLADTPAASFQALVGGVHTNIRDVDPSVPAKLAEMCDRATAANHTERYATAAEFLAELEGYLEANMRRVDRRDLSSVMAEHFKADRLEMSKRIEDQIGALRSHPSAEPRHSVSSSRAPTVIDLLRSRGERSLIPPSLESWWSLNKHAALVAAAIVAVGLVVLASTGRRTSVSPAPMPVAAAAPVHMMAPAPPPQPAFPAVTTMIAVPPPTGVPANFDDRPKAAASEMIRFSVRAEPGAAMLQLDGKKLAGNPFQSDMQREARGTHTVRVTAPGYFPVERSVSFARDINVVIALRPVPAAPPRAARRNDDPDPPPAPRAETKELEPGAELQRPDAARSGRRIDEKDPYGR
jgi:serine/threonine-protein kinase